MEMAWVAIWLYFDNDPPLAAITDFTSTEWFLVVSLSHPWHKAQLESFNIFSSLFLVLSPSYVSVSGFGRR